MKTILKSKTNERIIKKSKFISFCYKVEDVQSSLEYISEIKQKYKDTKHICYCYIVKENNIIKEQYFESTEPSGTSGFQIYNLMKKNELINSLIVVVRYFGGTKLGIGLLSRSYLNSAKDIIKDNIIDYIERIKQIISIPINKYNYFIDYCKNNNILFKKIIDLEFEIYFPKNLDIKEFLYFLKK